MSRLTPVPLNFRHFGGAENPPLVLLHGLLGSSRNWLSAGRELAVSFSVFALDLRNHGESPHAAPMDYPALAGDVVAWLDAQGLEKCRLLGHSMGGKAAMLFATQHPERVAGLTVVDIAPKDYREHNRAEFDAMNALDLAAVPSRQAADEMLAARGIGDWAMRQFLLTNLIRDDTGDFRWQINLPELTAALPVLVKNPLPPDACYNGPTLFVRGGKSDFIDDTDTAAIRHYFPQATVEMLEESGHNPHIEARGNFVALLRRVWAERDAPV